MAGGRFWLALLLAAVGLVVFWPIVPSVIFVWAMWSIHKRRRRIRNNPNQQTETVFFWWHW